MPQRRVIDCAHLTDFPEERTRDIRVDSTETHVFHLMSPCVKPQASGDGRVHVQRFLRDLLSKTCGEAREVTHIIESMRHAEREELRVLREGIDDEIQIFGIRVDVKPPERVEFLDQFFFLCGEWCQRKE